MKHSSPEVIDGDEHFGPSPGVVEGVLEVPFVEDLIKIFNGLQVPSAQAHERAPAAFALRASS